MRLAESAAKSLIPLLWAILKGSSLVYPQALCGRLFLRLFSSLAFATLSLEARALLSPVAFPLAWSPSLHEEGYPLAF